MKKVACISFLFLAAAILAAGPVHAGAADSTSLAAGDSTAAAPSDTTAKSSGGSSGLMVDQETEVQDGEEAAEDSTQTSWVLPVWKTVYRASESAYSLGTNMSLAFKPGGGWRGVSSINITKRDYRGRDMSDINEKFNNAAIKLAPNLYNFNLAIGQDYLRQKAIGLARSGGDMVIENKFVNAGFTWERPQFGAKMSRFGVMGRAGGGQNDFKYDNNFQANAAGYLKYGITSDLNVGGGYGIWRRLEDSDVSGRKFENMHSDMDTITAKVRWGAGEFKLLHLEYQRTVGVVRKVNPPRGNSLEVIENPDLAQMEKASMKTETILAKSRIQPLNSLTVDFEFNRDYYDQQNVVDERLSKETELKKLGTKVGYWYSESGRAEFVVERRENDVDYGPVSLSSYLESERTLKVSLTQNISDSVQVSLKGSGALKQRFYRKKDANPRDADYLNYYLLADLDAGLPLDIRAGVKFTYRQYETINIDRSLSGDNRTDYTYWVVPRFTLSPTDWFEIGQDYEIKMEFTDFTFKENENFLDRTTIMSTHAKFRFLRSHLGIKHRYQFIDSGSYLRPPDGSERLYGRTNESFEHRFDFRYEYMPVEEFTIFNYSNYRIQESNRLGAVDGEMGIISTRYYDSGQMTLGFSRLTKVTDSGKIDLNVGWVRRFGPNLTKERREFWEIDMNVEIKF
jgi:hypothetical protein